VGSGVEANAMQLLGVYGLTANDFTVINLPFGASADAMRDLTLDAFFVTAATPNTAVMELSTGRDIRILSLPDSTIQTLMSRYSFYVRVSVDSSDYPFLEQPINTVAVQATLIASTEMAEQVAYDIVKALIENQADIGHARGAYISAYNAVQSVSVDFHPGALRYFREVGAIR
jgi:TRAP transporter TAXI family solute receptor